MTRASGKSRGGRGWHLVRKGDRLTLARRWPPRADLSVETAFPAVRPTALAHELRKDVWRTFRDVRGLSPVVDVVSRTDALQVRVGVRLDGAAPPDLGLRLADLLADPRKRARWIAHAGRVRPGSKGRAC